MNRREVSAAFEIVLEELEAAVDSLNEDGAGAFKKGDYEAARKLAEDADQLTNFRDKVRGLQKEWETLFSARVPASIKKTQKPVQRSYSTRLGNGLRTPQSAFRRPILETLVESGGSASVSRVLERIEEKMKGILNDYDRQPLPSHPNVTRWENNAQWCRYSLVQEGFLKAGSPNGIWEISDKGKAALINNEI